MDFLGLRNLDVISDALEVIRESQGIELDIDSVPLDDQAALDLLCRGDSIGVFQLEGGPMRALMRSLAPSDRKSGVWGKSVSVRVDLGGRRIIQKKQHKNRRRIIEITTL